MQRALFLAASALVGAIVALPARAEPTPPRGEMLAEKNRGRPKIVLDRLEIPKDVQAWWVFKKYLRTAVKSEARRLDWGAGRDNKIEIRFFVEELAIVERDGVIEVSCTAVGRLPKGKVAKSRLTFGGRPEKRNELVRTVLRIVTRGVLTRLAELERIRRGDLDASRVRNPTNGS